MFTCPTQAYFLTCKMRKSYFNIKEECSQNGYTGLKMWPEKEEKLAEIPSFFFAVLLLTFSSHKLKTSLTFKFYFCQTI